MPKRTSQSDPPTPEHQRLADDAARQANWKRWGTYLPERQWATVREDYSADGDAWRDFPFEHSHQRAYRWGEDGLLGWCDRQCRLCFAVALWNGKDKILKERLFGLTNPQGNHGEDVKELYYYLDAAPTHAYARGLYKYPQAAFPYEQLINENQRRGKDAPEYELQDTGVFDDDRYFDVGIEYAKSTPNDVLIRVSVTNRGSDAAPLHVLPTWWFRNSWVWGCKHEGCSLKPQLKLQDDGSLKGDRESLEEIHCWAEGTQDRADEPWLFTDNETNFVAVYGGENVSRFTKDAFHRRVIHNDRKAVNARGFGTKAAAWYRMNLQPGETRVIRLRFALGKEGPGRRVKPFGRKFDEIFAERQRETDAFYDHVLPKSLDADRRAVARQALAGLLWTKQFYHYIIPAWLEGDPNMPPPPEIRKRGRNSNWDHLYCRDVISMPDKWEYPWFAMWDLAFHMAPFSRIDPHYTKRSLTRMLREWYMHRNGQLPAYEYDFNDVNPPVHAYACWQVYQAGKAAGEPDYDFLASAFQKLLLNFQWWVNREDPQGRDVFAGGFLGLDNIGLFDRNRKLDGARTLIQADGTAWMGFFCLNMLRIAIELAPQHRPYEDMASKFFEHFVAIADATNHLGGSGLWDEQDGFYYDWLDTGSGRRPLNVRSLVGLMPLLAVETIDHASVEPLAGFRKRVRWFMENRRDLAIHITLMHETTPGPGQCYLLALPSKDRLRRVLRYMLDPNEFLSPFGIRSLSRVYEANPYSVEIDGERHTIAYEPGVSHSEMFGGNSNWRGPIWWPINWLLVQSLRRYHHFYGDKFTVECPVGSGQQMNLNQVAGEIEKRLLNLFLYDKNGVRPAMREHRWSNTGDPAADLLLFHEYFHGCNGEGLGASHQTGWTSLAASLLLDSR